MFRAILLGSASAVCLIGIAQPASASDVQDQGPTASGAADAGGQGGQLEDIIVTAQRVGQNLQEVPLSVQAFTATSLEARNIDDTLSLSSVVPTLRFQSVGAINAPFLRGVGNNTAAPGNEASVALYVDDIYYGTQQSSTMRFNNIASIEVDKGPQGTLFGRNATGGVIQIRTREPSHDPSVDMEIGYGNFGTVSGKFYATTGVTDTLALDIALTGEKQNDGLGTNVFNGDDLYYGSSYGIRSKILWEPSASTKVTAILDYGRDWFQIGTAARRTAGSPAFQPAGNTVVYSGPPGFYDANLNLKPFTRVKGGGAALKIEHDAGWARLRSTSSYRKINSFSSIDADGTAEPLLEAPVYPQPERTLTQEFQLLSPDSNSRFNWLVGAFYYNNNGRLDDFELTGRLFGPGLRTSTLLATRSYSAFAQASYEIAPGTRLTLGGRYNIDKRKMDGQVALMTTPAIVVDRETSSPGGPVGPRRVTYKTPTWRISLDHQFSNDVMAYATVSRGFKSGTFNTASLNSAAVRPEKLTAYEIGIKTQLADDRVRLNLSGFRYDFKDLQLQRFEGATFVLSNAATAVIKGVEFDFEAAIVDGLSLTANAGYLDAKYKRFPGGQFFTPLPITTVNPALSDPGSGLLSYGGNLVSVADLSGKRLILAPKFSGNIGLTYAADLAGGQKLQFGSNLYYTSRIYYDPQNRVFQPRYATLDMSVKWSSADERFSVKLWGSNLTDHKIYAGINSSSVGDTTYPAPPRTYGITLGTSF